MEDEEAGLYVDALVDGLSTSTWRPHQRLDSLTRMFRMLPLLLIGCASHLAPAPPEEPGPESRFYLVSDDAGDTFMVRVTAATAEVEVVGPRIDFLADEETHFSENAPLDRALITTRGGGHAGAFAFRAREWASLCADPIDPHCYAVMTHDLGNLTVFPQFPDGRPARYQTYDGHGVGEQLEGRAGFGTAGWMVWEGPRDEWTLVNGRESRPLVLFDRERPLRAYASHLMTRGGSMGMEERWFRSIDDPEARRVRCPDGAAPGYHDGFELSRAYATCSGELARFGDGELLPTGVRQPTDGPLDHPVFVVDGHFSLTNNASGMRLLGRDGNLLGEYIRAAEEVEDGPDSVVYLRAFVQDAVGDAHGVAAILSLSWLRVAHTDVLLRHELLLLVFTPDGSVAPVPLREEFLYEATWLPRSVDRVFWIADDGRLMMRDTYEGVTTDVSAGWNFGG